MGKLFYYKKIPYGIENGYYRIFNIYYDPDCPFKDSKRFVWPYFKSWENLHKYIDSCIVLNSIFLGPKGPYQKLRSTS